MRKIIISQFVVLLAGTLFAWTNWLVELSGWLKKLSCEIGCSASAVSPFLTPCFGGAVFFTIAFILSIIILKNNK